MCVMGFTDTCSNSVPHVKNGATPTQLQSAIAACWLPEGARPDDCLLQRRLRMLFEQLLEKPYHLIRFAKDRRCATHHGECAGNIP
jgi:hypothetical protein